MKHSVHFLMAALVCEVFSLSANAEILDRPTGITIGEHLTLRPYVGMSITYDSNVDASARNTSFSSKKEDFLWTISPTLWAKYNADNWSLVLSAYYNYRQYFDSSHQNYNRHNFGENLCWKWSNSAGNEKGWALTLTEGYHQINSVDDMVLDGGENYSRNLKQLHVAGAVQRRFNEYWHADVNAGYNWVSYDNDPNRNYSYYGWDRVNVGAEVGFAPSKWTDIILAGQYQHYNQDNVEGSNLGSYSDGFSVFGGIGSYMTERISYRVLGGWSHFAYAGDTSANDGFVYQVSANWKISDTWNTMLLASSYYQPSERQYSSKSRVDAVSWGIAKTLVSGKLRATFDLRYRYETIESAASASSDYNLSIWTGRLGFDYTLCRFMALFAYAEYQNSTNDEASRMLGAYDYDRWRITAGFRVQY